MKPGQVLEIATAPARNSKHWQQSSIAWSEIQSWVAEPADHKECGNYLLGRLRGSLRQKSTIVSRSALTLDVDYPNPNFLDTYDLLLGYEAVIHTTWRSTPDEPRYRVILPTDRNLSPAEYRHVATVLMNQLGAEQFDPGSVQPERYMFKPSAPRRDWFQSTLIDGEPVPVDVLLQIAVPNEDSLKDGPTDKRDPFTLEGVVGAFNRVYQNFELLIEKYKLPYTYEGEDRWVLVGADSAAGMAIIRPGLVFSHHANDPAYGKACSAFDLARLHKFGHLDKDTDPDTLITDLPSHKAMLDLANEDPVVTIEMMAGDFEDEIDDIGDWRAKLKFTRTGKLYDNIANWDLICANDPVMQSLYFNEMSLAVEVRDDLPWRSLDHGGVTFSGVDRLSLAGYIERNYKIRPSRSLVDFIVETTAQQRYFNPVKDYLNGLRWDQKPRLETCLPGVSPTPYTRMVARKSLVAAVARIFDPGCKWDHSLILFGAEGIGKSHWVEKMARGYAASLGRIGDKDTLLAMQRSWIMISDEGHSFKKADADVQKEFLTRTKDVFRLPYDREAGEHPRHCVIWGTTNDEVFLRRQEGNRRFLIVRCSSRVDFQALTDEYIDQIWAEAVHHYRAGEQLYLEGVESEVAADEREQFIEEDALAGVLQEYLDTLVPADWDDMSPDARVIWLEGSRDRMVVGVKKITQTCSVQLWVEALGKRMGDHKRQDLLEINNALKRLPGWAALPGRHRLPHYGPQLVFERTG